MDIGTNTQGFSSYIHQALGTRSLNEFFGICKAIPTLNFEQQVTEPGYIIVANAAPLRTPNYQSVAETRPHSAAGI